LAINVDARPLAAISQSARDARRSLQDWAKILDGNAARMDPMAPA
jgi:hypothetical protein